MTTRIRITLKPTPNNDPGAGVLTIPKAWEGAQENLQLTVQRNDMQYLQDAKDNASPWAGSACNFTLNNLELVDGRLQVLIGANLIDPLVNSARTSPIHQIELKDQHGYSATGNLVITQAPLPSIAGGSSSKLDQNAVADTPDIPAPVAEPVAPIVESSAVEVPVVAAVEPPPVIQQPAPAPATTPGKKNTLIVLLLVLALAIAAAVGGWLWFKSKAKEPLAAQTSTKPESTQPEPEAEAPAAPEAEPELAEAVSDEAAPDEVAPAEVTPVAPEPVQATNPCDPSQMAKQSDLEFIQQCLKDSPDSARLLATIQQAKSNNHCSIAQRLYANRSQAGDLQIAAAYVKEYDPKYHQPSECFNEPNEATARYWYETILQEDPDNAEAKARLTELGQ